MLAAPPAGPPPAIGVQPLHGLAVAGRPLPLDGLEARLAGHVAGPQELAPDRAVLHPLRDDADGRIAGAHILGRSRRLAFDDACRAFLTATGEAVARKAATRERERVRLERLAEPDSGLV